MTKNTKPLLRVLDVVALVLIIVGFGILHNKSRALEIAGSICIGLGSLYFIVLLLRSYKQTDGSDQDQ